MVPRSAVFDPDKVGVYHCFSQCVRQLLLLEDDLPKVQQNNRRKQKIEQDLRHVASLMGFEVLDYSVMGSHLHVIVRNRPDVARTWSNREAGRRWWYLCPGRHNKDGSPAECTEEDLDKLESDPEFMTEIRRRLSDLGWFMWFVKGPIAKMANREDEKRGHFFAGRYKCKRLDDEGALLACSMYTALNPVRAGITGNPEEYKFSSLAARIAGQMRRTQRAMGMEVPGEDPDAWLASFFLDERAPVADESGNALSNEFPSPRLTEKGYLPMNLDRYRCLLQWTLAQERGSGPVAEMPEDLESILDGLGLAPGLWLDTVRRFEELFHYIVGTYEQMTRSASRLSQNWLQGVRACSERFGQKSDPGSATDASKPSASPG